MNRPRRSPAKALAIALGLAIALVPAASGVGASKRPAKAGTVKGCSLKKKAKCKKVKITKAKVGKVSLAGADLSGATITGATFTGTDLTGVNLAGAKITNTTFTDVKVGNLVLDGATLGAVKFIRVRGSAQAASELSRGRQRSEDCTAATVSKDDPLVPAGTDVFTCTGGGVSLRNATITASVSFTLSTIPGSDFSGVSRQGLGNHTSLTFLASDVSRSTFEARSAAVPPLLQFSDGQTADKSRWIKSKIEGSVLDGASIAFLYRTDAANTSWLGAGWITRPEKKDEVDLTGARGLDGAASVVVAAATGAGAPRGVRTVQIREDGYFRPGVLCTGLPCSMTVAVGAPVSIIAYATDPVALAVPGWVCADPVVTAGGYRSSCTSSAVPAGSGTGTASSPTSTSTVTVNMSNWFTSQPDPSLSATITELGSGGVVVGTRTCTGTATCQLVVTRGSTVRMAFSATSSVIDGYCASGATMFTGDPPFGRTYTCPDAVVSDDVVASVQTS